MKDIFLEYEFSLCELDKNNNGVEAVHKGAWFIVDNGFFG